MSPKLKKALRSILIAGALYMVVLIIEHTELIPIAKNTYVLFFLYLIPYYIVGWPVLRKAVKGMKNRQMFDESFLMALATVGAFVTQEFAEAVAVMLFYQIGEWFQSFAVGKSRKSISDLMDIAPEYANLEVDGVIEVVDPDDVGIGDLLVIKPGEKIPLDGIVVQGESMVNTSALTGESVPRMVRVDDEIISGCVNGEGLLKIKTTKLYEDSTVAKILELVENAASKKSRTENFITRFARYYTPVVVFSAVALAFIPPLLFGHFLTWIYRACTFLVISCPCALVVSVPLAFFGGIGASSKNGILVKGSNYLELMSTITTIVSDKTGTLTQGNFRVTKVIANAGYHKEDIIHTAAIAESMSTHPIAKSIKDADTQIENYQLDDFDNISGQGIVARYQDHEILVGNEKLMKTYQIAYSACADDMSTVVYVACDQQFMGVILIADEIKEEAKHVIQDLKKQGVKSFVMLTGDHRGVSEAVGTYLGVDAVYSELLPSDKVDIVEKLLQKRQGHLAFIGDGINDAPVLSRADIGIAMGSMGSDAAIEAADIVIMDDQLSRLSTVIKIARKTVDISKQNIVFALFVKFLILILGAVGLANMWAAVFADVGVAFLCILNAMRTLNI